MSDVVARVAVVGLAVERHVDRRGPDAPAVVVADAVLAGAPRQGVGTEPAAERVVARAAVERVVAVAALENVVAAVAADQVVAAEPADLLVLVATRQHVVERAADDHLEAADVVVLARHAVVGHTVLAEDDRGGRPGKGDRVADPDRVREAEGAEVAAAAKGVLAGARDDRVTVVATGDVVVARPAIELRRSGMAGDGERVVPLPALHRQERAHVADLVGRDVAGGEPVLARAAVEVVAPERVVTLVPVDRLSGQVVGATTPGDRVGGTADDRVRVPVARDLVRVTRADDGLDVADAVLALEPGHVEHEIGVARGLDLVGERQRVAPAAALDLPGKAAERVVARVRGVDVVDHAGHADRVVPGPPGYGQPPGLGNQQVIAA